MKIINFKTKILQLSFYLLAINFFGCKNKNETIVKKPKTKRIIKKVELILPNLSLLESKSLSEKYKGYLLHLAKTPKDVSLQFKLAECCRELGKYEEAATRYKYCYTVATNDLISKKEDVSIPDLSRYLEVICEKKNAFSKNINCDSNPLERTIRISQAYLKNGYEYKNEKIEKIFNDCNLRLLEKKEILVSYHLSKNNLIAANAVLKNIKESFSQINTIVPRCSYLECCILIQSGKIGEAKDIVDLLKINHPESALTTRAESRVNFFLKKTNEVKTYTQV